MQKRVYTPKNKAIMTEGLRGLGDIGEGLGSRVLLPGGVADKPRGTRYRPRGPAYVRHPVWDGFTRFNGSLGYAFPDMVEDHDGLGRLFEFQRLRGRIEIVKSIQSRLHRLNAQEEA